MGGWIVADEPIIGRRTWARSFLANLGGGGERGGLLLGWELLADEGFSSFALGFTVVVFFFPPWREYAPSCLLLRWETFSLGCSEHDWDGENVIVSRATYSFPHSGTTEIILSHSDIMEPQAGARLSDPLCVVVNALIIFVHAE